MPVQDQQEEEQDDRSQTGDTGEGVVEFDERRAKMERLRDEGIDPYPPSACGTRARGSRTSSRPHDPKELACGRPPRAALPGRRPADLPPRSRQDGLPGRARPVGVDPGGPARRRARVRRPTTASSASTSATSSAIEGCVYVTQRGQLALAVRRVHAAHQDAAPAARQAPRPRRHGHALPLPRARPARQRGDARAVHHAQQDRPRDPRMAGRAKLRGDRNARPAVAGGRRRIAAVHHPPQRARPRPVPAHLRRAVPQPLHRRRHGERLRHGQGVPQRGHLPQALARVHDHRVHVRLLRLQRRGHRDRRNVPRRGPEGARAHRRSCATARRSTSRSRGGG